MPERYKGWGRIELIFMSIYCVWLVVNVIRLLFSDENLDLLFLILFQYLYIVSIYRLYKLEWKELHALRDELWGEIKHNFRGGSR